MRLNFKQNKGLSMVELLTALVLLAVIMGTAYSVYIFSVKSFNAGTLRTEVQQNLRRAEDFIISETRYATEVNIIDPATVPTTVSNDYRYIFISNNTMVSRTINGSRSVPATAIANTSITLAFTSKASGKMLGVVLDAAGSQDFNLSTDIFLINMTGTITGSTNTAISYRTSKTYVVP